MMDWSPAPPLGGFPSSGHTLPARSRLYSGVFRAWDSGVRELEGAALRHRTQQRHQTGACYSNCSQSSRSSLAGVSRLTIHYESPALGPPPVTFGHARLILCRAGRVSGILEGFSSHHLTPGKLRYVAQAVLISYDSLERCCRKFLGPALRQVACSIVMHASL